MNDYYYEQIYEEATQAYNSYMFLYYVIPIVVIALVFGAIALSLTMGNSRTRKRQFLINQTAKNYLRKIGFISTSVFYFSDQATIRKSNDYKKMLLVDNKNKKFALINYTSGKTVIADYKEFLNYEIYEN